MRYVCKLCMLFELCKLHDLNKLCDLYKLYRYFMNHLKSVEIALNIIFFCFIKVLNIFR